MALSVGLPADSDLPLLNPTNQYAPTPASGTAKGPLQSVLEVREQTGRVPGGLTDLQTCAPRQVIGSTDDATFIEIDVVRPELRIQIAAAQEYLFDVGKFQNSFRTAFAPPTGLLHAAKWLRKRDSSKVQCNATRSESTRNR